MVSFPTSDTACICLFLPSCGQLIFCSWNRTRLALQAATQPNSAVNIVVGCNLGPLARRTVYVPQELVMNYECLCCHLPYLIVSVTSCDVILLDTVKHTTGMDMKHPICPERLPSSPPPAAFRLASDKADLSSPDHKILTRTCIHKIELVSQNWIYILLNSPGKGHAKASHSSTPPTGAVSCRSLCTISMSECTWYCRFSFSSAS